MKYFLLIALTVLVITSHAQNGFPKYDTARGVVIFYMENPYTEDMEIKADSAILLKRADKTVCQALGLVDCGMAFGHKCQLNWYEYRVILFRKGNLAIPVRNKISFHPNN